MSIREKAIDHLWKDMDEVADVGHDTVLHLYLSLIDHIDWNRVKLEAIGRCLTLHALDFDNDIDLGCGDCLHAVLLTEQTFPDWTKEVT